LVEGALGLSSTRAGGFCKAVVSIRGGRLDERCIDLITRGAGSVRESGALEFYR
jgi:hypothetical protein